LRRCGAKRKHALNGATIHRDARDALPDPIPRAKDFSRLLLHPRLPAPRSCGMILQACEDARARRRVYFATRWGNADRAKLFSVKGYVPVRPISIPLVNGESLPVIHMEKQA